MCLSCVLQVMETKDMLYMVMEYARNGEMFGKWKGVALEVSMMLGAIS